jgi:hypothetical protein
MLTVLEAEQEQQSKMLHDVMIHVSNGLNYLRDIKTLSHTEPDIPQAFRDQLWRTADLAQGQLESTLQRVAPDELDAWKDSRS